MQPRSWCAALMIWILTANVAFAGPAQRLRVQQMDVVDVPACSESGARSEIRLRATLVVETEDGTRQLTTEELSRLEIRERGSGRTVHPEDIRSRVDGEVSWEILVLVDTSATMNARSGGKRRIDAAVEGAKAFFDSLEGVRYRAAVASFDCKIPTADHWARSRWTDDPRLLAERVEAMKAKGQCTGLYNAIAEADAYISKRAEEEPDTHYLLVVISDGQNDVMDGRARLEDVDPQDYIAARGELPEIIRRVDRSSAELRAKLSANYATFVESMADRSYLRWMLAFDEGLFNREEQDAWGPDYVAVSSDDLRERLEDLRGSMNVSEVSFSSGVEHRDRINDLAWEFYLGSRHVGTFGPEILVTGMAPMSRPEPWEWSCGSKTTSWAIFGIGILMLVLLWFGVPSWLYREERTAS